VRITDIRFAHLLESQNSDVSIRFCLLHDSSAFLVYVRPVLEYNSVRVVTVSEAGHCENRESPEAVHQTT